MNEPPVTPDALWPDELPSEPLDTRPRAYALEGFQLFVAGYIAANLGMLDGVDVEALTTGSDYLPTLAVRRGTLGLVVHVDINLDDL